MEQPIIKPIDKEVLKAELTPDRQLRMTNKSNNKIFIVTAHEAPNVMLEIGRLREEAFREAGGGTGKECDLDEFDTCENCYKQLIVWNPDDEEIIGGYRYLEGTKWELNPQTGQPHLATCSISLNASCATTCPTPSSWAARSSRCPTRARRWERKASLRSTTSGTDSAR